MRLERVEIARLRGIPGDWPGLPIGEKGLIIYGPNGVGKSSIIDALEATIAGRSSLFAHPRAGVNWETASVHVKSGGRPTCTVRGKIGGKAHTLLLGETPPPDLVDWLKAAAAASFVLRRYMLLQFIDAEPRDRYNLIEPFLNLASFGELEQWLKEAVAALDTRVADATSQTAAKAQVIRQTFQLPRDAFFTNASLTDALKDQLTKAGVAQRDLSDLEKLADFIAAELGGEASSKKLALLGSARTHAQQLTSVSVILLLYEQVLAGADALVKELKSAVQKVPFELLTIARDYVATSPDNSCPVCEQKIDRAALLADLENRIRTNESVRLANDTLDERIKALVKAAAKARIAHASFRTSWDQTELGHLPQHYADAEKLLGKLEALTTKTAVDDKDAIKLAFGPAECDPTIQITAIDEAIAATGGGERRTRLANAASYVASLRGEVPNYEALTKQMAALSKHRGIFARLHAHAEAARKEAVQKIADGVAALANKYYDQVHPGEGIATAKLIVRQATAASMLLDSTFYGQEAPPLKYYSESHLDTLGLCFFLAIRKLEAASLPAFKFLLVDDVLHSVDADHRTRLAQLLKDHFSDHQIVLVTHDKNFYDRLRATLGGGYKYIAISGWDIDGGPRLSDPSTDLDRMMDPATRAGKSHDDIAAAGGRFFEWILKDLTEGLQVAIPARFTHPHDIGSMWPPLAAKLAKHKGFAAKNPAIVKKLDENVWVRNKIGAHDNKEAESPVTPAEVNEFANGVAALYVATTCQDPKCGTSITVSKDNKDVWRCGCSKLQYEAP